MVIYEAGIANCVLVFNGSIVDQLGIENALGLFENIVDLGRW